MINTLRKEENVPMPLPELPGKPRKNFRDAIRHSLIPFLVPFLIQRNYKMLPGVLRRLQRVRCEPEIEEIVDFLKKHPYAMLPYPFIFEYENRPIEVLTGEQSGYFYAFVNGNKYFFPKGVSREAIQDAVRIGLMEQDPRSPHRYQHDPSSRLTGNIAALVGASDCLFAVSIIPDFKHLVLFEADDRWREPMELSLSPFQPIAECVQKYIGNQDNEEFVKLDTFFAGRYEDVSFIQADIEGGELELLKGADALLTQSKKMSVSICCYHAREHETEIKDFLMARGFTVSTSPGYVVSFLADLLAHSLLRKGVIYATKG